ncbi:hypothetical protein JHN49_04475 [Streptomyces sp. MBT57]|nr:hypothetical protein [Streptomyces sp. MBT57]
MTLHHQDHQEDDMNAHHTPPLSPAAVSALTAMELAGEQARAALRAHETAGSTPDGEPAADAQTAADLPDPFAPEADIDDVLGALYSLTARISAQPQTAGQWRHIADLAGWISDAANSHAQDHDDESAGPAAPPSAPVRSTPERIAQIRREMDDTRRA